MPYIIEKDGKYLQERYPVNYWHKKPYHATFYENIEDIGGLARINDAEIREVDIKVK